MRLLNMDSGSPDYSDTRVRHGREPRRRLRTDTLLCRIRFFLLFCGIILQGFALTLRGIFAYPSALNSTNCSMSEKAKEYRERHEKSLRLPQDFLLPAMSMGMFIAVFLVTIIEMYIGGCNNEQVRQLFPCILRRYRRCRTVNRPPEEATDDGLQFRMLTSTGHHCSRHEMSLMPHFEDEPPRYSNLVGDTNDDQPDPPSYESAVDENSSALLHVCRRCTV